MKKLKIFNIILALIFMVSACDKAYDDIYDAIDEDNAVADALYLHNSDKEESAETYTLTDEDYETIEELALEDAVTEDEISDAEDIGSYKNFSAYIAAKDYIPYLLDDKFFSYEAGTEMLVTYNYYIGSSYEDVADLDAYELEDADYDMFADPGNYNNFSSSDPADEYIPLILAARYPLAEADDEMFVQYTYHGTHYDLYIELEFDGAVWIFTNATSGLDVDNAYELEDGDYEDMGSGPGGYHNFSSYDPPEDYLPDWMLTKYPSAVNGAKQSIIYTYYGTRDDLLLGFTKSGSGSWDKTHTVKYNWDSGDYNVKTLSETVDQTSIFKFTNDGWLFVPPLKFVETTAAATRFYELTDDDYELVGNGKYNNFDVYEGGADSTTEALIVKLSKILKANFNDLAVGDIFEVTYKGYDGGVSEYTINLEVQADE